MSPSVAYYVSTTSSPWTRLRRHALKGLKKVKKQALFLSLFACFLYFLRPFIDGLRRRVQGDNGRDLSKIDFEVWFRVTGCTNIVHSSRGTRSPALRGRCDTKQQHYTLQGDMLARLRFFKDRLRSQVQNDKNGVSVTRHLVYFVSHWAYGIGEHIPL